MSDELLHTLWTKAVGTQGYDKSEWQRMETRLYQHDSLLAEVERYRRALDKINAIRNSIVAYQSVGFSQHVYPLAASLEEAGFEGEGYEEAKAKAQTDLQRIASLEADNARLASEQQHCAKCGGVECHALAGLFCGEHSYEGCGEWNGCPICVNAGLREQNG